MASVIGKANEEETMWRLLAWLTKKGFIDDTELQKILCKDSMSDKKLEIYKLLMEKEENPVAIKILTTLRMWTAPIAPSLNNNGNHPLLNPVIADCIFGFLPIKDILNCRLVCLQWSIASKKILRQRVTIDFKTSGPSNFLNVFDNPFATDVPIQNFKFSDKNEGRDVSEIYNFFKQWGHNVKKLTFETNRLFAFHKNNILRRFDITPLIFMTPNLIKLKVAMLEMEDEGAMITVRLSQLSSIQHLTFTGEVCLIYIDSRIRPNMKIKPIKININSVSFIKERKPLSYILLNDAIDFSNATKIFLTNDNGHGAKVGINMEKSGILNANNLSLINVDRIDEWAAAKGSANFVYLSGPAFKQGKKLKIQQMLFEDSDVDISVLPPTIEKLHFAESIRFVRSVNSKCRLPNLKYLRLDVPFDFYLMPMIALYSNLVELELGQSYLNYETVIINVHWIPNSVKRLKINSMQVKISHNDEKNDGAGEEIPDESYVLKIDTLILEDYLHCLNTNVCQIMSRIKPSVLL